jgi:glycosyltransferase involved in cell wall biosynthesis
VITPTYEHARYVRECLESVVAQTVGDWELVVVDDGSGDDTLAQARLVGDQRIRILSRAHVGIDRLAETYNAGLAACRGTFVGILEGDDRWLRDKLEHQLAILRADPDVVVTYARYATIGAHGRRMATPPLAGPVRTGPFDALGPLLLDPFIELETALIRRDALEAIGGFRQLPGHRHVDYATFLALAERGPFLASDRIVAEWRRHSGSWTVQAVTAPANFEGPRACERLALETRRHHARRADLPSETAISASWSDVLARRYWHGGRVLHAQGRRAEARRLFARGLGVGSSLRQRSLLALGIVASFLRVDIERLTRAVRGGSSLGDL